MGAGRPRVFATPQELWDEFSEYCVNTKKQPQNRVTYGMKHSLLYWVKKKKKETPMTYLVVNGLKPIGVDCQIHRPVFRVLVLGVLYCHFIISYLRFMV